MPKLVTIFALMTVSAMLTGCGFQLRGAAPVPDALQPLSVRCDDSVPQSLCLAVESQLRQGQVTVTRGEEASYQLQLVNFRQQQRTSAVTARGEAAEYDLRQTLHLSLITRDQVPLIADTAVSAARSYRFDSTRVLAKRREQRELERTLYDTLARQVIFRLSPFDQTTIDEIRERSKAAREGQ